MTPPAYRGRFAPSPTGPLHFGSLVAAVASYADARHQHGEWLLRIEDVDEVRCKPGAEKQILDALQLFGMHWDHTVSRQSDRTERYRQVIQQLQQMQLAYPCTCSRKTVAATARIGSEGPIYPGTCRRHPPQSVDKAAWRMVVDDTPICFADRIVAETCQNLRTEIGDFVIRRIDGFTAYQLAVVIDDHDQGITDIVRGADLLWSTPRQIWLQRQLGFTTPRYAHLPLVYGDDGHKLSKRDSAHPVDERNPVRSLLAAWLHLGQRAPDELPCGSNEFWEWAVPKWDIGRVPHDRNIQHERANSV